MGAMYLSNGAYGYVPGERVVGDMAYGDSVYKNRSSQVEDYLKGVTTGTAAALNGFVMMLVAFGVGSWLGWRMDGSVFPLTNGIGFWAVAITTVAWVLVPRFGSPRTPPQRVV